MRIDFDSANVLSTRWDREASSSDGLHGQEKIKSAFGRSYTAWSHRMDPESTLEGRVSIGAKGSSFNLLPPLA